MSVTLTGGQAPAPDEVVKFMILDHGFPGTGKTAFGFSCPPPFWMYNLDRPIDPLLPKLPVGVQVEYEHIAQDVDETSMAVAKTYLAKFDALVTKAIRANEGTFIIDGFDILWDIVKIAKIPGGGEDAMPREWASANEYMNGALRRLGLSKLQVVLTTISSKIWTGAKTETERVKADGFKHKDRWLTHEVYFYTPENTREPLANPSQGKTGVQHQAYIAVSKLNENLVGRVLPSLTFSLLYKLTTGRTYPNASALWSPASSAVKEPVSAEA